MKKMLLVITSVIVIIFLIFIIIIHKKNETQDFIEFSEYNKSTDYSDFVASNSMQVSEYTHNSTDSSFSEDEKLPPAVYDTVIDVMSTNGFVEYDIESVIEDEEADRIFYNVIYDKEFLWFVYEVMSTGDSYAFSSY